MAFKATYDTVSAMTQMIYGIASLLAVTIFALALNTGLIRSSHRVFVNEVMTQLPGIGYEILDDIGRRDLPFDFATNEANYTPPVSYPLIRSPNLLTTEDSFGGCTDYLACEDIDDFDDMDVTVWRDSLEFEATIDVKYVDLNTLEVSPVQTYAKRVSVTVSSDAFLLNDDPFSMTVSRIFTYDRITESP